MPIICIQLYNIYSTLIQLQSKKKLQTFKISAYYMLYKPDWSEGIPAVSSDV